MRMILFAIQPQFTSTQEAVKAVLANVSQWFDGLRRDQFTRFRYHLFTKPGSGMLVGFRGNGTRCEVHINNNRLTYFTEQGTAA
ncbi:hypothetical protein VT84_06920 [Gemmata sp. SH-PL17]|uniref:hypothetical protein n=1 Tax=Gemmata sp. SH-PL17 TaxID=1630693 RepID=UPI00078EC915|nr:hypothetical protein [Gemmata sp. SH-PL17]AMV24111.1 hypothetical protein VT84_06920 [Gemmata sp. SH-PL17]